MLQHLKFKTFGEANAAAHAIAKSPELDWCDILLGADQVTMEDKSVFGGVFFKTDNGDIWYFNTGDKQYIHPQFDFSKSTFYLTFHLF